MTVDPRDWDRLYRSYGGRPIRLTRSATWDGDRRRFDGYRDATGGLHFRVGWWMLHITGLRR